MENFVQTSMLVGHAIFAHSIIGFAIQYLKIGELHYA